MISAKKCITCEHWWADNSAEHTSLGSGNLYNFFYRDPSNPVVRSVLRFTGRLSQGNRQRSSCGWLMSFEAYEVALIMDWPGEPKMNAVCFLVTIYLQCTVLPLQWTFLWNFITKKIVWPGILIAHGIAKHLVSTYIFSDFFASASVPMYSFPNSFPFDNLGLIYVYVLPFCEVCWICELLYFVPISFWSFFMQLLALLWIYIHLSHIYIQHYS